MNRRGFLGAMLAAAAAPAYVRAASLMPARQLTPYIIGIDWGIAEPSYLAFVHPDWRLEDHGADALRYGLDVLRPGRRDGSLGTVPRHRTSQEQLNWMYRQLLDNIGMASIPSLMRG